MGLFSGPRPATPVRERSMTMPEVYYAATSGTFANASVAGTGAMASVAVRSATDLICSLVSELPVHVYRGEGSTRRQLTTPGNIEDPGDDSMGLEDWTYQLLGSFLHRGNVYGDPITDRLGYLRGLSLYNPDACRPTLDSTSGRVSWTVNGKPAPSLFHRRVNPIPGMLLGFSPVEAHAATILTGIAGTRFAHQWFTEGTHPSSMLVNSESDVTPEQARVVLQRWRAMKTGTREPAVMGKGWELKGLDITPEQAQLLELIGASEAQACRIFGPAVAETLGYESGGSMTYTNIVDRRADLLVLTLNRWIRRVDRLLTSMLPAPQYARHDRDALLESTTLARYEAYTKALQAGFRTINEVRDDEDLAPVPWGAEPLGYAGTTAGGTDGNTAG